MLDLKYLFERYHPSPCWWQVYHDCFAYLEKYDASYTDLNRLRGCYVKEYHQLSKGLTSFCRNGYEPLDYMKINISCMNVVINEFKLKMRI